MTGQMLELTVQSLTHDGRGVCRDGQRVVFVRGALPGQRVRALVTSVKTRFAEGQCVEVLTESPHAVAAACPHAGLCGGCPLQTMPYDKQLYWKGQILAQALERIGKVSCSPEPVLASPQVWGYRNKMEFAFGSGEDSCALGLRGAGSHRVTDITHCLLMPQGSMEVVARVREGARASGLPAWDDEAGAGFWRFAVLRMPTAPGFDGRPQVLLCLITAPGSEKERAEVARLGAALMQEGCVSGFVHEERRSLAPVAQGERTVLRLGQAFLRETLGGIAYRVDHGGFFQINTAAAEKLCTLAGEMAALEEGAIMWDLYCGVGAPGLSLAGRVHGKDKGGKGANKAAPLLFGVESQAAAVNMAQRNAADAGIDGCRYVVGEARRAVARWPEPQVVLVDPPRSGLHADLVRAIVKAAPRRVVYISCNPATLARDVALLGPRYAVRRLAAVDLFPHTGHVESVALLTREGA